MPTTISCDLAIVGGGLAGGLIALALAKTRPGLDVRIVEGSDSIGGNHLWSFFASDVADATAGSSRRSSAMAGRSTISRFRRIAAR